jgi:hypothetical protein
MRPSISPASCDAIARPSPVPPYRRVVDASACVKASKIDACFSGGIPIPVSLTAKWRTARSSLLLSQPTRRTTSPCSVNFTALLIRLTRICVSRRGSPPRIGGTSGAT